MNGQMITNIHEDIVKVLVERLEKTPEHALITYGELCEAIGNQVHYRSIASYLGDLSCWCNDIGAPMLSALVINSYSCRPGKGFFRLYADLYGKTVKLMDEDEVFVTEYKKVVTYRKWNVFKFYLGI